MAFVFCEDVSERIGLMQISAERYLSASVALTQIFGRGKPWRDSAMRVVGLCFFARVCLLVLKL